METNTINLIGTELGRVFDLTFLAHDVNPWQLRTVRRGYHIWERPDGDAVVYAARRDQVEPDTSAHACRTIGAAIEWARGW